MFEFVWLQFSVVRCYIIVHYEESTISRRVQVNSREKYSFMSSLAGLSM